MATPNIVNVATIQGATVAGNLSSTSATGILDVSAENTWKVNVLAISNVDGVSDAAISCEISVDNGSNYYHLAKTVTVPADSTVHLITKDTAIYLDETDLLRLTASAANDLNYVCSYEILVD
jgi:hypothetical protein|tara:strand:+ start:494 stop:859 length:366 start_codon:yes stop_codon:yes gene_type:complete